MFIGKSLEKIVHKQTMKHLEYHMLLDAKQGGFIPNHLTIDMITTFSEQIYQNINNGNIEIATYIDLKKAFDTVNHNIFSEIR